MVIFVAIGLICGLFTACLTVCCKTVFLYRITAQRRWGRTYSLVNVVMLTTLAVLTYVYLPLAFSCKQSAAVQYGGAYLSNPGSLINTSATHNSTVPSAANASGVPAHRSLAGGAYFEARNRCPEWEYNPMATIAQAHPEHTVSQLWSKGSHFDPAVLVVFLLVYAFQFILLTGIDRSIDYIYLHTYSSFYICVAFFFDTWLDILVFTQQRRHTAHTS